MKTYAYGFPRLGENREFKKAIESYWKNLEEGLLYNKLESLEKEMLTGYSCCVDEYPSAEMTKYDHMLDMAIMLGLYKPRNLDEYFEFCRGKNALEMTKWFNTNYHYLVPNFDGVKPADLALNWNKAAEYARKTDAPPFLLGPFTFLKLSKGIRKKDFPDFMSRIASLYRKALAKISSVHIHEPAFILEVSREEVDTIKKAYSEIAASGTAVSVFTYYGSVDFLEDLCDLPLSAIGLDFVHGEDNLPRIEEMDFPKSITLIAGLVDGQNVFRTVFNQALEVLRRLNPKVEKLALSNAGPLYHLPVTLEGEDLDPFLQSRLAFASEKLEEIKALADAFEDGSSSGAGTSGNMAGPVRSAGARGTRAGGSDADGDQQVAPVTRDEVVRHRVAALTKEDFKREPGYESRRQIQKKRFGLPLFPTTTIGSFPQTAEIRAKRSAFRKGQISEDEYNQFIKNTIRETIRCQEELDLDVLVHGESERTDMVEFFAHKLSGIVFTKKGWILSYGTRGYRPPIIYSDVSRIDPMTIEEIRYAQSLTDRPVKGMLTGPVTIIAWSFVREDIPIHEVSYQIALALRDEIADYEKAGISMVQVDEPAFRELAPNKKRNWPDYFNWAIRSFRLACSGAKPETQIHSHMCYSEFNEIIEEIRQMDFDVISIEATRSRGEVLLSFEEVDFDREIGLGVWDIHSPHIPSEEEIGEVIERAIKVINKENFWINPDCGLKTRGWEESIPSLKNMVSQAKKFRKQLGS